MEKRFVFRFFKLTCVSLICCSMCLDISAQSVQVAQRTVDKNISASGIERVVISSEKADVIVQAWSKDQIQVTVELTARHSEKAQSLKDLGKMELIASKERKTYHLRDFILLKGGDSKPQSNLKARYTVYAPPHISFDIQSAFGEVALKGFNGQVKLKGNFCNIKMSALSGKTSLETSFGKLEADALSGGLEVTASHTQIVLKGLGGRVSLSTLYGSLLVQPGNRLTSLDLRLKKTSVELVCPEWKKYRYALTGAYTKFKLPDGFKMSSQQSDKQVAGYTGSENISVVVNAEFGDLKIR